ncbi:hypothetical protein ABK040_000634 [Willaertia magna]
MPTQQEIRCSPERLAKKIEELPWVPVERGIPYLVKYGVALCLPDKNFFLDFEKVEDWKDEDYKNMFEACLGKHFEEEYLEQWDRKALFYSPKVVGILANLDQHYCEMLFKYFDCRVERFLLKYAFDQLRYFNERLKLSESPLLGKIHGCFERLVITYHWDGYISDGWIRPSYMTKRNDDLIDWQYRWHLVWNSRLGSCLPACLTDSLDSVKEFTNNLWQSFNCNLKIQYYYKNYLHK